MRVARFLGMGSLLAAAGYFVVRFDAVPIAAADDSARPFYAPNSTLLLDARDPLATRGRPHVVFRIAGEKGFRVGRVVARAGQTLETREGERGLELAVDGSSTGLRLRPFDDPERCTGRVPADAVFVVSLVPGSDVVDSRTLGPLRRAQLAGRVLMQLPW
jgi:hypothetical protein